MKKLIQGRYWLWIGLLLTTLLFAFLYFESRQEIATYKKTVEKDAADLLRVKSSLRERMEREIEETVDDVRTKSLFEAFNSYAYAHPSSEPIFIGEYQQVVPAYKSVNYVCLDGEFESNQEIFDLKKLLEVNENIVSWCRDEKSGLMIVKDDISVRAYLIQLGESSSVISETKFVGVNHSLALIEPEILEWRRSEVKFFPQDWIKLQLVETLESVSGGIEQVVDSGYNKYVYAFSGSGGGELIELCSYAAPSFWQPKPELKCSHVVGTSRPVMGR